MATYDEISVANRALYQLNIGARISGSGDLSSSSDTSEAKDAAEFAFPFVRDEVLEEGRWTFATKYATLVQADDGEDDEWGDEWDLAYTLPSDCLRAVRFVTGAGGAFYSLDWDQLLAWPFAATETPGSKARFAIRNEGSGRILLTDVPNADAKLQYIAQVTDMAQWPNLAATALSMRLAYELAGPLLSADDKTKFALYQGYMVAMSRAMAADANEESPRREPDGPAIRARSSWYL